MLRKSLWSAKGTRSRLHYRPELHWLEERAVPTAVGFYIDETYSTLTLSGTLANQPIQPQGPGALTANLFGLIFGDVDTAGLAISFTPDSYAGAYDVNPWQPRAGGAAGAEPAAFGPQASIFGITGRAAVREAYFTAYTDAPLVLTDYGGGVYTYPSTQTLGIIYGWADYNAAGFMGREDMSGLYGTNQAGDSVLYDFGDGTYYMESYILFIFSDTIGGIPVNLRIEGTIYSYGYAGSSPGGGGSGGGQFDLAPALSYVTWMAPQGASAQSGTLSAEMIPDPFVPNAPAQDLQAAQTEIAAPVETMTSHEQAVDTLFTDLFQFA